MMLLTTAGVESICKVAKCEALCWHNGCRACSARPCTEGRLKLLPCCKVHRRGAASRMMNGHNLFVEYIDDHA